ncbi:MAG TPA: outer membrane lipoprotein-sorting protein [Rhodocyclaceae bacterium]|nr:outer membrane lipoprotein-sorting protein [Rhodocyclaceae bacterium]
MKRIFCFAAGMVSLSATAAISTQAGTSGTLTADQIIERNIAARGGLDAWRSVGTLTMSGTLEAGGKKNTALPFVLKLKRSNKSRLEIKFADQMAVQVYDGTQGWKVRPFLGRNEVEPYTAAESKAAESWQELDGPLIDHANKGTRVSLVGEEAVEGRRAYKLKLTLKSGEERHLWVDAANFLEVKTDGEPRKMDGKLRNVAIYYRDYKAEQGLNVPHTFETVVEGFKQAQPHKMSIERVTVNPPLDDKLFTRPELPVAKASIQQER